MLQTAVVSQVQDLFFPLCTEIQTDSSVSFFQIHASLGYIPISEYLTVSCSSSASSPLLINIQRSLHPSKGQQQEHFKPPSTDTEPEQRHSPQPTPLPAFAHSPSENTSGCSCDAGQYLLTAAGCAPACSTGMEGGQTMAGSC